MQGGSLDHSESAESVCKSGEGRAQARSNLVSPIGRVVRTREIFMSSKLLPLSVFALALAIVFASLPEAVATESVSPVCVPLGSGTKGQAKEAATFIAEQVAAGRANIHSHGVTICAW